MGNTSYPDQRFHNRDGVFVGEFCNGRFYRDGMYVGELCGNGKIYIDGRVVGDVGEDNTLWLEGSRSGQFDPKEFFFKIIMGR